MYQHTNKQFLLLSALLVSSIAFASPAKTPKSERVPCGHIEDFGGVVQVLDSNRSQVTDAKKGEVVACGAWISVEQGWVKVGHRQGQKVQLGPHTFLSFSNYNKAGKELGDQVVLLRGKVYFEGEMGTPQFRVSTSNARVRMDQGKSVLIYNDRDEITQLIVLENQADLENRFRGDRTVTAMAGEATSLDFGQMRVVPSTPRALSRAKLIPVLAELHLNRKQMRTAAIAVSKRMKRKFAHKGKKRAKELPVRRLASVKEPSYVRHLNQPDDMKAHKAYVQKVVGSKEMSAKLLYPNKKHVKAPTGRLEVIDSSDKFVAKEKMKEDREKKRLMKELSKIRIR